MNTRLGAFFGLSLLLATPAFSADAARQMTHQMGNGLCNGMMPVMGMMTMMGPNLYNQHADGCLSAIKQALNITAGQEPQWSAFANAVRDNIGTMIDMFESMMMLDDPRTTLSARLQFEEKTMAQHLASVKRIKETLASLQSVLTSDQKATARSLPFVQ